MLFLKNTLSVKLIYDVHENYERNILYGSGYAPILRSNLAISIRALERSAIPYLDGVIYAESGYDNILNVPEERKIILRNLYVSSGMPSNIPLPHQPFILITGTLAREWGTLEAIEAYKIVAKHTDYQLVIAGYCPNPTYLKSINDAINSHPRIFLEGISQPVPYPRIEQLIQNSSFGFALYEPSIRMADRVPTKFFEYAAYGKPLFFSDFEPWNWLNEQYHFGVPVIYNDPAKIADRIFSFLQNDRWEIGSDPKFYSWEYEKQMWIDWLSQMIY